MTVRRATMFAGTVLTGLFYALATLPAVGQDGPQLEPWRLQVTPESAAAPGKSGRRLAVLLVDTSSSMQRLPDGQEAFGAAGEAKSRWAIVRREVDAMLQALAARSPGIEVRIYYFGAELDCVAPKSATLNSVQDANTLMQQFPKRAASGGTMLYQSLSLTCGRALREHAAEPVEWLFFALLSDGEDSGSPAAFKDGKDRWDLKLDAVRKSIATQAVVLPVGSEAEAMVKKGHFGNLKDVHVGSSIPAPPPPRTVYRLELAPGATKGVATGLLAVKDARYRVPVEIDLSKVPEADRAGLARSSQVTAAVAGTPATFTLEGSPLALGGGALSLTPSSATDVAAGTSCTLVVSVVRSADGEKDDSLPTLRGEGSRTYAFRAQVVPKDPSKWRVRAPAHAKIGDAIECFVDLSEPQISWRFSDGQAMKGAAVSVVGKSEGPLRASIDAVSSDGKKATKADAATIEVIDASFTIDTKGEALLNQPIEFSAKAVGRSKADYEWFNNGSPCGTGGSLSIRPASVGDFDLSCTATSEVGQFTWTVTKKVEVKLAPGLQLNAPTVVTEGESAVAVDCTAFGLEGSAALALGRNPAKPTQTADIKFDKPGDKIGSIAFTIDRDLARQSITGDSTTGRVLPIRVSAGPDGSYSTAADVAVLPLDARPTLKSPKANASVPFSQDTELVFAIEGADGGAIDALAVEVVDAKGAKVAEAQLNRAGAWKMNLHPKSDGSMTSPLRVRGKLTGPSVWFERPMVELATLHLRAREGDYAPQWDPPTPVAYNPLKISMTGLQDHDKGVAWQLTPTEPAGPELRSLENPWVTPRLYPGKYALTAVVTLEDGSKKQVPTASVTVPQPSNFLVVEDSVQVGKPFAGRLDELRIPMEAVKKVRWTGPGLTAPTAGPPSTHASHQFHPSEWGIHEVGVEVRFQDDSVLSDRKPVEVRGTSPSADPRVEPAEVTEGTAIVKLVPNVKGDCTAVRVVVRATKTDGTAFEMEVPCAREQSEVDVPVPEEVTEFEVVVSPVPFTGNKGQVEPSSQRVMVVPRAQWWWWLAALAILFIITYLLGKHLFGNEPLRWTLEFGADDPGPPTADSGNLGSLRIGPRRKAPSDQPWETYQGWSRRHKIAYVPLWYLQERLESDDTAWLSEGQNPNLRVRINNACGNPFGVWLPGPEQGWGAPEFAHPHAPSDAIPTSETWLMTAPVPHRDDPRRKLWIRAKCPMGRDPLLWIFWVWVGVAAVTLVVLLPVFHMTGPFI